MVFGRKQTGGASPTEPIDGREWVQKKLAPTDQPGSMEQARAHGIKLFDTAYEAMKNERGVRIEDITGMLASVGGHLCLTAVLDGLAQDGLSPTAIGMAVVSGNDGNTYYFGDAPNWLLCEASYSLISLVFGAAHEHGAPVNMAMLHDEMRSLAQRVGSPEFLDLELPEAHAVDNPMEWARVFTPMVRGSVLGGLAPQVRLPIVVGFALQQAIDVGRQSLAPMTMATIAMKCALRTAKIDPQRVGALHA